MYSQTETLKELTRKNEILLTRLNKMPDKEKIIPLLSLPLAAFVVTASIAGMLSHGFYSNENHSWAVQSSGQDAVDLFLISPLLIVTVILISQKNKIAIPVWAGTNLYLSYTFAIYCFDLHFNRIFLIYCFCLGLSVFSFIYYLIALQKESPGYNLKHRTPLRYIGIYFIIISSLFYLLWLGDIIPAIINDTIPASLAQTGLFTNPVEVLDLSLILPFIFLSGLLLLKGKSFGFVLAPVLLTFIFLMDVTVSVLTFFAGYNGIAIDISIGIVMLMMAIFSLALLIIYFINIRSCNLRYYHEHR